MGRDSAVLGTSDGNRQLPLGKWCVCVPGCLGEPSSIVPNAELGTRPVAYPSHVPGTK